MVRRNTLGGWDGRVFFGILGVPVADPRPLKYGSFPRLIEIHGMYIMVSI